MASPVHVLIYKMDHHNSASGKMIRYPIWKARGRLHGKSAVLAVSHDKKDLMRLFPDHEMADE